MSIITLLALVGVALGVVILLVTLAVMSGFEREIKSRILGFTPHLTVEYGPMGMLEPIEDWTGLAAEVEKVEGVEEGYAQLRDFTLLEVRDLIHPVEFRAIDTQNERQTAALEELIDKEDYPGGTARMGLDEKAVLSETAAKRFGITVGDTIQLYSARNLNELSRAYKITDEPPVAEAYADIIEAIRADLRSKFRVEDARESFAFPDLEKIYYGVKDIHDRPIRPGEQEILVGILELLNSGEASAEGDRRLLPAGTVEQCEDLFDSLGGLDLEKEDARVLKGLREIVLPKELEVVGIYQASQHVLHPDVFVPLPTGQELKNLRGGVEAIGVRLVDPYEAGAARERLRAALPDGYYVSTWMDQYGTWFALIRRERMMLSFVLGFIALGAAFMIGGVMLLLAIQKKREIGVLLALGARPIQICWVFLIQGAIVGFLGSLLGYGLTLVILANRAAIQGWLAGRGVDPFPAEFHGIDVIPAYLERPTTLTVCIAAFVLCWFAPLIPALIAALRDPAKSLRNM